MYDNGMQIVLPKNHSLESKAIAHDKDKLLLSLKTKFIGKHKYFLDMNVSMCAIQMSEIFMWCHNEYEYF